MFTGQRSGSGSNFFKIVKGITLHWAPVLILYETWIPFEGRVIDQSEFSMKVWLIWAESWILTVLIKKNNRSGWRVHQIPPFQLHVLFYQDVGQQTLKWFILMRTWQIFPLAGHLPRRCELSRNLSLLCSDCKCCD